MSLINFTEMSGVLNLGNRYKIYSIFLESSEKGYVFQSLDALLCYSVCCLLSNEIDEAYKSLFRVLDYSAKFEDDTARLFAYHYLAVCIGYKGERRVALDFNQRALNLIANDSRMRESLIYKYLTYNKALLSESFHLMPPENETSRFIGELIWHPFHRV